MAANPISATEIKSHWRQEFSSSLTNNGLQFGQFMKRTKGQIIRPHLVPVGRQDSSSELFGCFCLLWLSFCLPCLLRVLRRLLIDRLC